MVCNPSIIAPEGGNCIGAPDMIIEVLSPSTAYMDGHIDQVPVYVLEGCEVDLSTVFEED